MDWKEVLQLPKHGQMEQVPQTDNEVRPPNWCYQRPLPVIVLEHMQLENQVYSTVPLLIQMECLQDKHSQMFHSQMVTL